jgi:hypothetical protein
MSVSDAYRTPTSLQLLQRQLSKLEKKAFAPPRGPPIIRPNSAHALFSRQSLHGEGPSQRERASG